MRRGVLALLAAAAAGAGPGRPEQLRLPVTADTSICMVPAEQDFNLGKTDRIKMKGNENVLLLAFDPTPLKGKRVVKARLRIRGVKHAMSVRRVGFSTVAAPWSEGNSTHYGRGAPGDSCFLSPELGRDRPWAGPGSDFLDVLWGRGGTFWTQGLAVQDPQMWFDIPFDGRILEACAAGLSHGIAVSDDCGQISNISREADPNVDPNHNFFSREHRGSEPFFLAEAEPAPPGTTGSLRVEVVPWPGGADFQSGGLEVRWPGPRSEEEFSSTLGYRLFLGIEGSPPRELPRWMHPPLARPGEACRALLKGLPGGTLARVEVETVVRGGRIGARGSATGRVSPKLLPPPPLDLPRLDRPSGPPGPVWAIPDLCKAHPVTGNVLEENGVDYEGPPAGNYRRQNPVWSAADRSVSLTAARGEWIAFQIVCEGTGRHAVTPSELHGPGGASLPGPVLSRAWYHRSGNGWYADPLLPLSPGEVFTIPDPANGIPDQRNQTIYVEYFVPRDARPGGYQGTLQVDAQTLSVRLEVEDLKIPETASFVWSLNAYHSPGRGFGPPLSEEFLTAERAFYAMAHAHRTTLAILHYSHSGHYEEGCVPPVTGRGPAMRVADWSAWDRRFGPLFDGSAFRGTFREGVPLDHFYLALCEHYPTPMTQGYRWNHLRWEDHWREAGRIEEGFSREYQEQWVAVAKDYLRHIREKGWKTTFHVYLNDKYYHKQYDPRRRGPGRGVSFWLLDEPAHVDDFLALAFFGRLLRQAQGGDRERLVFRVDLSRPQFARDLLDRVMDLDVSGAFDRYGRFLEEWRERWGHRNWTYGAAPPSRISALSIAAQALDLYSRGIDGFVPWLALGIEDDWRNFSPTALLYPGRPRGIRGPCASLRLKACRRGEQDVERLRIWAERKGLLRDDPHRRRLAQLLSEIFRGPRFREVLDAEGAATERIASLLPETLEGLRRALAAR